MFNKGKESQLFSFQEGRSALKITKDILTAGGETLQKTGIKGFHQRYTSWVKATGDFDAEEDELPLAEEIMDADSEAEIDFSDEEEEEDEDEEEDFDNTNDNYE